MDGLLTFGRGACEKGSYLLRGEDITISCIKPSSAFGSAISSRIVVSNVPMFREGVQHPCEQCKDMKSPRGQLYRSILTEVHSQRHRTNLRRHLESVKAYSPSIINVGVVNRGAKSYLRRFEWVSDVNGSIII